MPKEAAVTQAPSIGRIVHYKLSAGDVEQINQHSPAVVDGHQVRNSVSEGEVYPAVIVRVFDEASGCANLRVLLDGCADYWATSRGRGEDAARWDWPARV